MCDKLNLTIIEEFGEHPLMSYDEIYGLLTNEQSKSLFSNDCGTYFARVYQVVHGVFKEDVLWLNTMLENYTNEKYMSLMSFTQKRR